MSKLKYNHNRAYHLNFKDLRYMYFGNSLVLSVSILVVTICTHRGSYMSAHVLLNLINELGKGLSARLAEIFISFSQRV